MASYTFVITDGPDEGRKFDLTPGITLLGRRDTPDQNDPVDSHRWILTDPAVSRTHARIDWDGKRPPLLIHLSSTNATLLDGRIVTGQSIEDGQSLAHGNRLRLGQTGIAVEEKSDSGRWCIEEQTDSDNLIELESGESVLLDGVEFQCSGSIVEVSLAKQDSEAYLLRKMGGQFWTTAVYFDRKTTLSTRDIVRTGDKKFVVIDREVEASDKTSASKVSEDTRATQSMAAPPA